MPAMMKRIKFKYMWLCEIDKTIAVSICHNI